MSRVDARLRRDALAPARARRYAADLCHELPMGSLHEVLLLTTELVNNALWHGRGEAWLDVEVEPGLVRVGVSDRGGGQVERAQQFSWPEAGHGLRIIESMSDEWGVQLLAAGKRVWFELSWRPAVPDSQLGSLPHHDASRH